MTNAQRSLGAVFDEYQNCIKIFYVAEKIIFSGQESNPSNLKKNTPYLMTPFDNSGSTLCIPNDGRILTFLHQKQPFI